MKREAMNPTAAPRAAALIQEGIAAGLHAGAQCCVMLDGRVVVDAAFGQAAPDVAMRPETLTAWLSAGKPLAAAALARLWEQGRLEPEDPVCRHVPEFAAQGKERITLWHLLTHTGGFPRAGARLDTPTQRPRVTWERIIAEICAAPPEPGWQPGRRAAYHPASSWYVLAEVIRRVAGRPFEVCLRELVFEPLGMHESRFMFDERTAEAYRAAGRLGGIGPSHAGQSVVPPAAPSPAELAALRPGGGARGPARELARFYEALRLGGLLEGRRMLSSSTVGVLLAPHRTGMQDETFKYPMEWGLGFILNAAARSPAPVGAAPGLRRLMPYGYGPHAGPRTFGHGGAQSVAAFCDPDAGLVCVVAFNGQPGDGAHQRRIHRLLGVLYEELLNREP